jgi:hypothetical protein
MSLGGWSQLARHQLWQAELAGGTDDPDRTSSPSACLGGRPLPAVRRGHPGALAGSARACGAGYARRLACCRRDPAGGGRARGPAELVETFWPRPAPLETRRARRCRRRSASTCARRSIAAPSRPLIRPSRPWASPVSSGSPPRTAASPRMSRNCGCRCCSIPPSPAARAARNRPTGTARPGFAARAVRAWGGSSWRPCLLLRLRRGHRPDLCRQAAARRPGAGEGSGGEAHDPPPRLDPALDLEQRTAAAETVLRAMSLTGNFARVVLLAGHGASVINNPHASALHCGACGGYSGEVNARLLAALLNDPEVRAGLAQRGIDDPGRHAVPRRPARHDDRPSRCLRYRSPVAGHAATCEQVRAWLAGRRTDAGERALAPAARRRRSDIAARSRNWAEVRPEWALAGCKAFIAAPRSAPPGATSRAAPSCTTTTGAG